MRVVRVVLSVGLLGLAAGLGLDVEHRISVRSPTAVFQRRRAVCHAEDKGKFDIVTRALACIETSKDIVEYKRHGNKPLQVDVRKVQKGLVLRGSLQDYALVRKVDVLAFWGEDTFGGGFTSTKRPRDIYVKGAKRYIDDSMNRITKALVLKPSSASFDIVPFFDNLLVSSFETCLNPDIVQTGQREAFERYHLEKKFAQGGQGEVWEAVDARRTNTPSTNGETPPDEDKTFSGAPPESFVLKRIFIERGEQYRLSGLREAVFGKRLQNKREIARFVESFNHTDVSSDGKPVQNMWLVFRHEGQSLDAMLYSKVISAGTLFVESSALWHRMRRDAIGAYVRRDILQQILEGLVVLEKMHVAHRDMKPSNILISEYTGKPRKRHGRYTNGRSFQVKLSDFGSAVDTNDNLLNSWLYGKQGPTQDEETKNYRPPEAFLAGVTTLRFPYLGDDYTSVNGVSSKLPFHAYDMWSVGVIALEMLLGTSKIFRPEDRARARIDLEMNRLRHYYSSEQAFQSARELRYNLKALESFGISPEPEKTSKEKFRKRLETIDPLKRGFYFNKKSKFRDMDEMKAYGDNELSFVWSLLSWSPFDRPTPEQALDHPFFF